MDTRQNLRDAPESYTEAAPVAVSGNGQYVTFSCSGKAYGVDIMSVREIRSWSPTTELPEQPHAACGVLDIRGEVIQVFDLKALIGGGRTEVTDGHVVLVVSIAGHNAGILVDAVSDIIHVGKDDMRPVPATSRRDNAMVSGLAKHDNQIVAILNLSPVLGASTGWAH